MFSTTYIAEYVKVFTVFTLLFNFEVNEEELTFFISSVVIIGSSLWTLYKRYKIGGVSILGIRKR